MGHLLKTRDYTIHISNDLSLLNKVFDFKKYSRKIVFTDENSRAYCLPLLVEKIPTLGNTLILEIPEGEDFKNLDTCSQLWKSLFKENIDRKSLWINLGGGVVSDLGGFVARTYKRGIDFINVPTTLLSQVDATVGGKLGVNFEGIKNGIGLFDNPKRVFIYPGFLKTLPQEELFSGLAEIIKHALIAQPDLWKRLENFHPERVKDWVPLIYESLKVKYKIVQEDMYEKNTRKLLNFGHTFGHALESAGLASKNHHLLHGQAVALGMVGEAYLSKRKTGLQQGDFEMIAGRILKTYNGYFHKKMINRKLITWMQHDKKNENENFNFTLLKSIGKGQIDCYCSKEEIREAIDFLQDRLK